MEKAITEILSKFVSRKEIEKIVDEMPVLLVDTRKNPYDKEIMTRAVDIEDLKKSLTGGK
jgi:hypothetical protein